VFSLTESVNEFAQLMLAQLNLKTEAKNLEKFKFNFRDSHYVAFAAPFDSFTSENVLVESYIDGNLVADLFVSPEGVDEGTRKRLAHLGSTIIC
jgi:aarF domain-containing kinase